MNPYRHRLLTSKALLIQRLRLWRPLADQGVNGAQYGLGLMYDKGRGVSQDFVHAHMWFDLSAAQGNQNRS